MSFRWDPISENEIRLLRRNGSAVSGELSFDLQTFSHESAPPYAAISYMCGPPPDDNVILVNDLKFHVRRNCLHTLQQVEQHDEYPHIWLDCVCINQVDLDEKSRQVQSMGKIYRLADAVLACIGYRSDVPSVHSLAEAIATLKRLSDFNEPTKSLRSAVYWQWLDTLSNRQLKSLIRELNLLAALPYWERLWIIQEIHLGKAIKLYFGGSCLEWRGVVALHNGIDSDIRPHLGAMSALFDAEERYKNRAYDFYVALETFKRAKCSVPRDRVYGLRELIKWPQTLGPITPDYNMDPFELAQEALKYLRSEQCEREVADDREILHIASVLLESLAITSTNILLSREILGLRRALEDPCEESLLPDMVKH